MKKIKYYNKYINTIIASLIILKIINNLKNKYLKLSFKILLYPFLFIFNYLYYIKLLLTNSLYIPYLEIVITTKCNLNCTNCANFIPKFHNKELIDNNNLLKQIDYLFNNVDYIHTVRLLGGEPFLNKDLNIIIKKILNTKKIKNLVIVTNGTVLINDKNLINTLTEKRVSVDISDYNIKKNEKFINILTYNNIKHFIFKPKFWYDFGDGSYQKKSNEELENQFKKCNSVCRSYFDGKLFYCAQSSSLYNLGITKNKTDYIDFANVKNNIVFKNEVFEFLVKTKYQSACSYCNKGTKNYIKIDVASQED